VQAESRLKGLIGQQPDAHFAHFALGNVYAAQERWPEAQQAYFRAYAGDSGNPDYQFNLAVSLEHLRQPALALRYYQGAMRAAESRPAAFEPAEAAERIRQLAR
jgi:predicted Zn-dependent protease